MSNSYYNSTSLTANTRAKAEDINTITQGIAAGFDKVPAPNSGAPTIKGFGETFIIEDATARNEPLSLGQFQDSDSQYVEDEGVADAYVVTLSPAITAYTTGHRILMKVAN